VHVFICWSGRRSRRVAKAIAGQWLPEMFQTKVTSFASFTDIEKGEGWFDRLVAELGKADAAVLCLTPENLASPWMHFESGMVSRLGKGIVFTFFLGSDAGKIQDPLKQIQVTVSTEPDTKRLALKLAALAQVAESEVQTRWASAWSKLADVIREVETPGMEDLYPGFTKLFERKTFDERLEECADQLWLKRYEGARDTARAVDSHRDLIAGAAKPWQLWLYDKLIHQVDGYVDEIKQYLLLERPFDVGEKGTIDFASPRPVTPSPAPRSLSVICERRCREIRHAVFCLTRPDHGAPVLPESLAFTKLRRDQFDDKKQMVHVRGWRVDRASLGIRTDEDLERCARSVWDYDRIMYYKARETEPTTIASMIGCVGQELEKAQAEDEPSLMALHYAVKSLASTIGRATGEAYDRREAASLLDEIEEFLNAAGPNSHPKIRRNIADIRTMLTTIPLRS